MDEKIARQILETTIQPDNGLHDLCWYLNWFPGHEEVTLDGGFNADDLEAIAWWMRNKK